MQNDQIFNAQTDERVSDAEATKSNPVGNTLSKSIGTSLRTGQGGEIISPAGATAESLSAPFTHTHGSLYASIPLERSIQTEQTLESVPTAQKDARIGGTGPVVGSNGVGIQAIPSSSTSRIISTTNSVKSITGTNYTTGSGTTNTITLSPNPVRSVFTVYSGATVYPQAALNASGAGWYNSGNTLSFKNGVYAKFSGAAGASLIPPSGGLFSVDYTYYLTTTHTGTMSSESYTMPGNNGVVDTFIPNVGNRFAR